MSAQDAYRLALQLRETLRPVTTVIAVHNCPYGYRRSFGRLVENGCQNVHACPICTRRIQARSRERLITSGAELEKQGFGAWHLTLTLSFGEAKPGERYQFLLGKVWKRFRLTNAFRAAVSSNEFGGYVRVLEETLTWPGTVNPHLHVVIFWKGGEQQLQQLLEAWQKVAENAGSRSTLVANQSLEPIYDLRGLSWYLFKHMYLDVRKEPAVMGDEVSPVECLLRYSETRGLDWLALWFIFETASAGHKRVLFRLNAC